MKRLVLVALVTVSCVHASSDALIETVRGQHFDTLTGALGAGILGGSLWKLTTGKKSSSCGISKNLEDGLDDLMCLGAGGATALGYMVVTPVFQVPAKYNSYVLAAGVSTAAVVALWKNVR